MQPPVKTPWRHERDLIRRLRCRGRGCRAVNIIDWVPPMRPASAISHRSRREPVGDFVLAEVTVRKTAPQRLMLKDRTDANGIVNDTTFAEGLLVTGNSLAAGEVEGKAVGQAVRDPISLSVIASVAVAEPGLGGIKTLVEVSTIDSASLSTGSAARPWAEQKGLPPHRASSS